MKKFLSVLIFTIIVLATVWLFFVKQEKNTISSQENYFKLKNTLEVTKIEIQKKNENITISKNKENLWLINEKYLARQETIHELIKLAADIEILSRLSLQDKNQFKNQIEDNLIEITIFKRKKNLQNYYISGIMVDNNLMSVVSDKGLDNIFLVRASSSTFNLYSVFNTNVNFLRQKTLLHLMPYQIKQVKLIKKEPENGSFILNILKNNSFQIVPFKNTDSYFSLNSESVELYLGNFQNINFENEINNKNLFDSLKNSIPYVSIDIQKINDSIISLQVYEKPIQGKENIFGEIITVDPDFCFVLKSREKNIFETKYTEIEHVIKSFEYFIDPEKRKD